MICMLRPNCTGTNCNVIKAPTEKDFDKYVYRMGDSKCYEFKTVITECPQSGAIEAFRESQKDGFNDQFVRRNTPIRQRE